MAVGGRGIQPRSLTELQRMGEMMVRGGIAPKGMTAEGACAVMLFGMELGLSPIQSLRDICFINGRPTAYGDAVSGLLNRSGLLAAAPEVRWTGAGEALACTVVLRRKGISGEYVGEYSIAKAKRASLAGKDNWRAYPERMVFWRAFSYAARDGFSDVLKGLTTREEAMDLPAEDYRVIDSRPVPASLPETSQVPIADDLEVELSAISPSQQEAPPAEARPSPAQGGEAPAEPGQKDPPPNAGEDHYKLWQQLSSMRKDLGVEGIRKVKAALGVDSLSPSLTVDQLRVAVEVAQDLAR